MGVAEWLGADGGTRQVAHKVLNVMIFVAGCVVFWGACRLITNTDSPVVVVLSPVEAGDIVVYHIHGREPAIPIVHRVVNAHGGDEGQVLLTKGDNNPVDDRGLYNRGQLWLEPKDVMGRVRGYVPYVGYAAIVATDYPAAKFVLVGTLCLLVFLGKDQ